MNRTQLMDIAEKTARTAREFAMQALTTAQQKGPAWMDVAVERTAPIPGVSRVTVKLRELLEQYLPENASGAEASAGEQAEGSDTAPARKSQKRKNKSKHDALVEIADAAVHTEQATAAAESSEQKDVTEPSAKH